MSGIGFLQLPPLLPLPLTQRWGNDLREDSNGRGFQGLSNVQALADLLHSCEFVAARLLLEGFLILSFFMFFGFLG